MEKKSMIGFWTTAKPCSKLAVFLFRLLAAHEPFDYVVLIIGRFCSLLSLIPLSIVFEKWRKVPVLTLSDEGITFGRNKTYIRWVEVEATSYQSIRAFEYLTITIYDWNDLIKRSSGISKACMMFSRYYKGRQIIVTANMLLNISKKELHKEITTRCCYNTELGGFY